MPLQYRLGGFSLVPATDNGVGLLSYGQLDNEVFMPLDNCEFVRMRSAPISRATGVGKVLVSLSVCGRILEAWFQPQISFRVYDGGRVLAELKSPAGFPDGIPTRSTPSTKGEPLWPKMGLSSHTVANTKVIAVPLSDDVGHGTDDTGMRVMYSIHYPYPGVLWLMEEKTPNPAPPPAWLLRAPYYDYGPAGYSSINLFEWSAITVEFIAP